MFAKPITELALSDEVFTHIDTDEAKTVRHFDVSSMKRYAEAAVQTDIVYGKVPLDADQVKFVRENRGIEQPRIDRLEGEWLDAPVILIFWADDNSAMVVDGNHRFVKKGELGHEFIKAYIFPQYVWERFLVDIPGCNDIVGHSGMGKSHIIGRPGAFSA